MTQGGYMWLGRQETSRAKRKPFFRADGKTFIGHVPFSGQETYPFKGPLSAIPDPHKWHIYGYEANDQYWAFYLDGELMYGGKRQIIDVRDIHALPNFHCQHFLMLNVLATKGPSLRDGIEPSGRMDVDWVRCYSYNDEVGAASSHIWRLWQTYPRVLPDCVTDPMRESDRWRKWPNGSCRWHDVVINGGGSGAGETDEGSQLTAAAAMRHLWTETGLMAEDIAPICLALRDREAGERPANLGNASWVPLAYAACASMA
ncbi:unnamed protein product [Vitrella brassicaformis CCMP3155]|uniref:Uncharacterized protein n=1 Tax=Vitrella brassicaformis (strain CCMP3155) TaxID=1169540 RepID=A0A0G4ES62_VITBC|nr:unnamed protein product [Vitrella brassicaformis CCMP3155]|eukprot:CEM00885.1 unnamed protein product [Vitrella brassicaformis CCMP3155]